MKYNSLVSNGLLQELYPNISQSWHVGDSIVAPSDRDTSRWETLGMLDV